ncbi:hypothetical protein AgCh_030439 [Apium graveolens]
MPKANLLNSAVLVVGGGGLGSRALLYLTACGVDATDNSPSRYVISDCCAVLGKVLKPVVESDNLIGVRLAKSRVGIERAHGKESSRVRIFQRGRCPELPLYLRMDILEGVVAYHSQQLKKSKAFLNIVKIHTLIASYRLMLLLICDMAGSGGFGFYVSSSLSDIVD